MGENLTGHYLLVKIFTARRLVLGMGTHASGVLPMASRLGTPEACVALSLNHAAFRLPARLFFKAAIRSMTLPSSRSGTSTSMMSLQLLALLLNQLQQLFGLLVLERFHRECFFECF